MAQNGATPRLIDAIIRPSLPGVDIRAIGYAFGPTHEGWPAEEILDADAVLGTP
jgi:hypothetical protein